MCTYANYKEDGIYIIIATKNQENKIEGFLRSCLFKIFYGKREKLFIYIPNLLHLKVFFVII